MGCVSTFRLTEAVKMDIRGDGLVGEEASVSDVPGLLFTTRKVSIP